MNKLHISRDSDVPIYEQVEEYLRACITAGQFAPGERLPGIKTFAKKLGINHLTLRQALRGLEEKRLVATESARGTFVLSPSRTQLRVALVLPNLLESTSRLSGGAQREFSHTQSTVDIFHYDEDPALEASCYQRLSDEGYDGAVVFPSLSQDSLKPLLRLIITGFPLIFIDRAPAQTPVWRVAADNFRGGYLATEHLIRQGCQRIACEASEMEGARDRYEGFLHAMGDHRLPVDQSLVHKYFGRDDRLEEALAQWMSLPEPPDGIVFGNDFHALRGLQSLNAHGRKVPQDVRIIGFDDLPVAPLSLPPLSTIRQDFAALGRAAATLLTEQIALPKDKRFCSRTEVVPVELILRESA